jgi:hypothetical protein
VSIVEAPDASPEQLEIREANQFIHVSADALWPALDTLTPVNAQFTSPMPCEAS